MSDADKPSPEAPQGGTSEEQSSPGLGSANVISIEQARAELLRKPRSRVTPPRGTSPTGRSRGREVPSPVTLPPGEHSAVIVADTPAARVHVDKKTVHPGEAPNQTHEKKVRVKTSLDPRRAKTQLTDRRADEPDMGTMEPAPITGAPPSSTPWPRSSSPPSDRPRASSPPSDRPRPSLARPRKIQRPQRSGAPLFLIGVAIAAGLGATVVFVLGRQKLDSHPSGSADTALVAPQPPRPTAPPAASAPPSTQLPSPGLTAEQPEAPPVFTTLPSGGASTGKTGHSPSTKPSSSAASAPSVKPTSTSVLPFGKEEN